MADQDRVQEQEREQKARKQPERGGGASGRGKRQRKEGGRRSQQSMPQDKEGGAGQGEAQGGVGSEQAKSMHNKRMGAIGEDVAARFLASKGYEIVARNWSCKSGEADIIARDEDMLVFVEVKSRSSTEKGQPSEAVDKRKQQKYVKIASAFCQRYDAEDITLRFDVVALLFASENRALIRHYINAFGAE